MISRNLASRVERLEGPTRTGRIVPLWSYGKSRSEVDAEIATLKANGSLRVQDKLTLITWMSRGDADSRG